jgi:hypothetical protein
MRRLPLLPGMPVTSRVVVLIFVLAVVCVIPTAAQALTFTVLHSFAGVEGARYIVPSCWKLQRKFQSISRAGLPGDTKWACIRSAMASAQYAVAIQLQLGTAAVSRRELNEIRGRQTIDLSDQ